MKGYDYNREKARSLLTDILTPTDILTLKYLYKMKFLKKMFIASLVQLVNGWISETGHCVEYIYFNFKNTAYFFSFSIAPYEIHISGNGTLEQSTISRL